jgi:hypothetical protein
MISDGTVIWTAPTGRTYITKPVHAGVFPELARRRRRTRAADRPLRIVAGTQSQSHPTPDQRGAAPTV